MANLEHSDLILALDKQQHPSNPNCKRCPRNPDHGAMLTHAGGAHFLCCLCGATELAALVNS